MTHFSKKRPILRPIAVPAKEKSILKNQHFHQIIHFPTDFSITRSQCIKNSEFKLFADAMVQKQPVVRQDLKI